MHFSFQKNVGTQCKWEKAIMEKNPAITEIIYKLCSKYFQDFTSYVAAFIDTDIDNS